MNGFHSIDWVLLVAFFFAFIWIGFKFVGKKSGPLDFLVGGRALTLPVFVLTLFSTWYGGILGIGEFGFLYGISTWITQGVPYYFFAVIFALVFARRAREKEVVSIPEQLEKTYGRSVGMLGAIFVGILSCPAPYMLMSAVLLQWMTGWSIGFCLFFAVGTSLLYLWFGGFKADVATDIYFGFLMIFGFMVILPFLFLRYGGWEFVSSRIPESHLSWHGGNSPQFLVMWFFMALWTFVEPSFYQRCYAAKTGSVAVRGIFLSIALWFMFDLMTVGVALYAKAILQDLSTPMLAYPILADRVLPPVWKALFFSGMFATILSTMNSQLFVSGMAIGKDFLGKITVTGSDGLYWVRFGMVISSLTSVILAVTIPSVVTLWYAIGSVLVPGLLLGVLSTFFSPLQIAPKWMLTTMSVGFVVSSFCLAWGWRNELGSSTHFLFGMEPMFPGLLASVMVWSIGKIADLRRVPDQV